jgi:hypothetical protein
MAVLSVFTVTSATGDGTTSTYTGTITSGATPLVSGMPIIVAGFVAQVGFNGTNVINGGNLTTTFTALNATNSSETHAATGTVDPEGAQSWPTDVSPGDPLGFGINRFPSPYSYDTYGNVTSVTSSGSQQYIEV